MWWQATVSALAAVVVAQQFNMNDESDYVDDADEGDPSSKSIWVSEIVVSTEGARTTDMHGEVEKLLGQPIIHYEEPVTIVIPTDESTRGPTRSASPSRHQTSASRPSRRSNMHWTDLGVLSLSTIKAMKSKTRRGRHRTSEVIYSVHVPQWDDNPRVGQKFRPGVIESLVKAHDVIRYEAPRNPPKPYHGSTRTYEVPTVVNQTAYNEGGFRTTQNEENLKVLPLASTDGRRYLLTVPGAHLTATPRPRRPTPITEPLVFSYLFTRRTNRHPNCTDSYYECLNKCFDRKGYKVKCPWYTTKPRPEPARVNFTGLFFAIHREDRWTDYDVSNLFKSFSAKLIELKYRECRTFTTRTTTTVKIYPIYYDQLISPKTGRIVAKCWVCGLMESGIPENAHCAENFGSNPSSVALAEKNSYRRYCRFMDEVPLWFNRSDPLSVFGEWTGGCSKRWLDLSGLYTQRTCRSLTTPAVGHHFLSKRMARLELALRDVKEGCVTSPMATLVPFSRAVSLFARFHVCVCRGHFCNLASRKALSLGLTMLCLVVKVLGF
ncbi:uncharacterized protein LOC133531925 [Cydia pomonella]|uniref:uncharacterized protein LOC133531925 n=1 Tax=Cydia pomonella TaxID=82600 RepID=UPI002ADDB633|nr:uncharacterized protein LOC133531925 [Cydia pomonella]